MRWGWTVFPISLRYLRSWLGRIRRNSGRGWGRNRGRGWRDVGIVVGGSRRMGVGRLLKRSGSFDLPVGVGEEVFDLRVEGVLLEDRDGMAGVGDDPEIRLG